MARYLTIEDGREYLWDFDENRILLVTYGDTENIKQVEFSTDDANGSNTWTSEVMTNLTTGNKYVQVPNEFLNGEYSRLVCYVIAEDETGQHTRTKEIFRIKKRQQPEDYEITFTDRVYIRDLKAIAERYRDQAKSYSEQAAASSTQAGQYNSEALASKNAAAESERNAEASMESAQSAQHGAESARNDANAILTLVQSKGTEITNFVDTSKAELETQKNESLKEVRSVYTADLDELKGDLIEVKKTFTNEKNALQAGKLLAFDDFSIWENASLSSDGKTLQFGTKNRLATNTDIIFEQNTVIHVPNNFKLYGFYFTNSGELIESTGWKQGNVTISANTPYRFIVARVDEIEGEVLSKELLYLFTIDFSFSKNVDNINDVVSLHSSLYNTLDLSIDNFKYKENENIESNGFVTPTPSAIFVSSLYGCEKGDTISFRLSCETNKIIFAVYDKNGKMTYCVKGSGYSNYIESSYTFTENDFCFRFSGGINRISSDYSIRYGALPTYREVINRIENIENMENIGILPDYWESHIENKIQTIKNNLSTIGNNGDSIIFITDTHIDTNSLYSPKLISRIVKTTTIRNVFNGGDTLGEGGEKAKEVNKLYAWREMMYGINEFCVVGNHDDNNYNGQNSENALSFGDFYSSMNRQNENTVNTNGKPYFVLDNESQKIRYIIVSNSAFNNFDSVEKSWLQERLTEKDTQWTIVVFVHYLWGSTLGTLHSQGTKVINAINEVYANINADFVGIIAGHSHADYSEKESVHGYNLITTLCDTRDSLNGYIARTKGTVNEQAFDVVSIDKSQKKLFFTRIGCGDDREFTY